MTPSQRRSAASKKAARSRRRMKAARETITLSDNSPRNLAERILALTTPDVSSGWVAERLRTNAAYVRAVWRRGGLDKRPMGVNPPTCQQRRSRASA